MLPPARHIRVTGCPSGHPSSCVPEHAQAPGLAGGTGGVARRNGAGHRNGQAGSVALRPPWGHLAPLLHPGGDGDAPKAPQGGGRGGSWRLPEFLLALWLSGEKFGWGVPRLARWQHQQQPGRAGWAHREFSPAPRLSASPISSDFWASSERFLYHLHTPRMFSSHGFARHMAVL